MILFLFFSKFFFISLSLKVKNHEMNEIRKACMDVATNGSYKPGVTFVVASKRNHTRFFPIHDNDKVWNILEEHIENIKLKENNLLKIGKAGNVPPGSLVDTKIVTKDMMDFFLVSHQGIQGTSKPCHYFVLHDENNFTMNQLGLLTHYL